MSMSKLQNVLMQLSGPQQGSLLPSVLLLYLAQGQSQTACGPGAVPGHPCRAVERQPCWRTVPDLPQRAVGMQLYLR